jgi:hypothetical protein
VIKKISQKKSELKVLHFTQFKSNKMCCEKLIYLSIFNKQSLVIQKEKNLSHNIHMFLTTLIWPKYKFWKTFPKIIYEDKIGISRWKKHDGEEKKSNTSVVGSRRKEPFLEKKNIFKYENIRMEQIKEQFNFETFYLYYHFLATS